MTEDFLARLNFQLTPETIGELAAKACINDLGKSWAEMEGAGLCATPARLLVEIDSAIETLIRFRSHIRSMESKARFKILPGDKPAS